MEVGNLPDLASPLEKFCQLRHLSYYSCMWYLTQEAIGSPKAGVDRQTLEAQTSRPGVRKSGINLGPAVLSTVAILGKPRMVS